MDFFKNIETIEFTNPLLKELNSPHTPKNYYIKLALYKENEKILLLEIKNLQSLSEQNLTNLFKTLFASNKNSLNFKFLVKKENSQFFLAFEYTDTITLQNYLEKNNSDLGTRLYFFKKILEIIYDLKANGCNFEYFDSNLFFISNSMRHVVRTIYHGN
jgi:hypothetical protein